MNDAYLTYVSSTSLKKMLGTQQMLDTLFFLCQGEDMRVTVLSQHHSLACALVFSYRWCLPQVTLHFSPTFPCPLANEAVI